MPNYESSQITGKHSKAPSLHALNRRADAAWSLRNRPETE